MFSVDSGHGDIARILLNSGADPDHINNNGQTAADIAATAVTAGKRFASASQV